MLVRSTMSDVIYVAAITTGASLLTVFGTQTFETIRERWRLSAAGRQLANERQLRRDELLTSVRSKQVEAIRDWIKRQHVTGLDTSFLLLGQGMSEHIGTLLAWQREQPTAMSVNVALADVSDIELVDAIRALVRLGDQTKMALHPFANFLGSAPGPWTPEQSQAAAALYAPVPELIEKLDEAIVDINGRLERYCVGL